MRPLRAPESKEHYLTRHRQLAMTVSRPVYAADDGRLLLVSGSPDPAKMFRYLSHLGDGNGHIVTPADLGFAGGCVEPLSEGKLSAASRALNKLRRSPSMRSRRHAELETLDARLAQLHAWRRQAECDQLPSSFWLLDAEQEQSLSSALNQGPVNGPGTQRAWFARLVMWCSGPQAMARFCQAAAHLPEPSREANCRPLLRASLAKLEVWAKRCKTEHWKVIRAEVKEWIGRLPRPVVSRAGLSSKLQRDKIFHQLEDQRFRCNQALRECDDGGRPLLLAAVATLTACDHSGAELPPALLHHWSAETSRNRVSESCVALAAELGTRSYGRLLSFLGDAPETRSSDYPLIRSQLDRGESIEDVTWVLREELQECFTRKGLRPSWARRQLDRLKAAGIELDSSDVWDLFSAMPNEENRQALQDLVGWTASLPRAARTPRLCRLLKTVLTGPVLKALSKLGLHKELSVWSSAVRRGSQPSASGRLAAWESYVEQARAATGREKKPARQVGRSVAWRDKRRREYDYLCRLIDRGVANGSQRARCEHLRPEVHSANPACEAKLLRSLQKSYVVASVDALLKGIRTGAESLLTDDLAARLADHSVARVLDFAVWAKEMTAEQRRLLVDILSAHRRHGADYKQRLPGNGAWLDQARRGGVEALAWLSPKPWTAVLIGKPVSIAVSTDPVETFLMGDYFGTCLSLGDCNQMSVLANAADANKHVVYARDAGGRIFARKLIAVSKEWGLLGYYCYGRGDEASDGEKDPLVEAVEEYCVRIAKRSGLRLVDDGEPETIGGRFWYDDGTMDWERPVPSTPPVPIAPVVGGVEYACVGVV